MAIDWSDRSKWDDGFVTDNGERFEVLQAPVGQYMGAGFMWGKNGDRTLCYLSVDGTAISARNRTGSAKIIPRPERILGWVAIQKCSRQQACIAYCSNVYSKANLEKEFPEPEYTHVPIDVELKQ